MASHRSHRQGRRARRERFLFGPTTRRILPGEHQRTSGGFVASRHRASVPTPASAHALPTRRVEALGHVGPVPDVPHGVEVLVLAVLILEIEGVLPRVEHEQRRARLRQVRLVVVDLRDEKLLAERLPDQRGPAGAHDARRDGVHLFLKLLEAPELILDRGRQLALRPPARLRRHVVPEQRMEDVPRQVEREGPLEGRDAVELTLFPRVGETIEGGVCPLHVAGVVLVVVQLHDPAGDVGLERAVVVGKVGKRVGRHRTISSLLVAASRRFRGSPAGSLPECVERRRGVQSFFAVDSRRTSDRPTSRRTSETIASESQVERKQRLDDPPLLPTQFGFPMGPAEWARGRGSRVENSRRARRIDDDC